MSKNHEKWLFGTDRMITALNEDAGAEPEGILRNVHMAVDRFVGTAEQFDDITMLCLKYLGSDTRGESHE